MATPSVIDVRLGGAHVAMEQEGGLNLHAEPGVRVFRRAFRFDGQLIVHLGDPGQTLDRVFGQRFVGRFGNCARQGDDAVLGFGLIASSLR